MLRRDQESPTSPPRAGLGGARISQLTGDAHHGVGLRTGFGVLVAGAADVVLRHPPPAEGDQRLGSQEPDFRVVRSGLDGRAAGLNRLLDGGDGGVRFAAVGLHFADEEQRLGPPGMGRSVARGPPVSLLGTAESPLGGVGRGVEVLPAQSLTAQAGERAAPADQSFDIAGGSGQGLLEGRHRPPVGVAGRVRRADLGFDVGQVAPGRGQVVTGIGELAGDQRDGLLTGVDRGPEAGTRLVVEPHVCFGLARPR